MQLLVRPALASPPAPQSAVHAVQDVTTYHGNNLRTGGFSSETHLTARNIGPETCGLVAKIVLDGRVDAEPLVVIGQPIDGEKVRDTVYVATQNDTVYALDTDQG